MSNSVLRVLSRVLIVFALMWVATPTEAPAEDLKNVGRDIVLVSVGVGILIGVGIYFAVRQPRVTGCVASNPEGNLTLQGSNPGDPLYLLEGKTTGVQAGSRLKVVGRKKKDAKQQKVLMVSRVAKTYGACSPAAPHAFMANPLPGTVGAPADVVDFGTAFGGMNVAGAQ